MVMSWLVLLCTAFLGLGRACPRGPETWVVGSLMSLLVVAMERKVVVPSRNPP